MLNNQATTIFIPETLITSVCVANVVNFEKRFHMIHKTKFIAKISVAYAHIDYYIFSMIN